MWLALPPTNLAIRPAMLETVLEGLATSGVPEEARVIVERPFGPDFASPRRLNRVLRSVFPESAVLASTATGGKEPIENLFLLPVRELGQSGTDTTSPACRSPWPRNFGVQGQGRLYDATGAPAGAVGRSSEGTWCTATTSATVVRRL